MARLAGRIGGRRKGMIAVLISIRPKWCEKIISGEKTIEVRKTRPKLIPQFKCYIYCTLPKYPHEDFIATDYPRPQFYGGGKVIGEFTCNRVTNLFSNSRFWLDEDDVLHTCLSAAEMRKYANGANGLYGWHISNLKIYDTPKELIEFHTWKKCKSCNKSGYESTACIYDENCIIPAAITKAPQSWCYVEEETWND
jgi:predicted transcriptional regulator